MNQQVLFDYYDILQISPNAEQETIDKVYRFLAKKYHPDNGSGEGNADKFRAIIEAYRVLSDPEKRAAYDAKYEGKSHLRDSNYDMDSDNDVPRTTEDYSKGFSYISIGREDGTRFTPGWGLLS